MTGGAAELRIPRLFRGFPQVFAVAPSVNLGLGSLPPERLKYASGLFNRMRNLGEAVGIAVGGAVLNDRTNFAMDQLMGAVAQRYGAILDVHQAHTAALKQLWQLTYRGRRRWPMPTPSGSS